MAFTYSTNSSLDEAQSIFLCAQIRKDQRLSQIDYFFFFPIKVRDLQGT